MLELQSVPFILFITYKIVLSQGRVTFSDITNSSVIDICAMREDYRLSKCFFFSEMRHVPTYDPSSGQGLTLTLHPVSDISLVSMILFSGIVGDAVLH